MNFNVLEEYNYWKSLPKALGLIRSEYLNRIEEYDQTSGMIVITGARRSGKSVLVKQYIDRLIKHEIPSKNILYFNFYLRQLTSFTKENEFFLAITAWTKLINRQYKSYIIIDEVQELENWDHIVASLIEDHTINSKIIITGSNSKLLASEATTKLSGRYYSITVYPFSYKEFSEAKKLDAQDSKTFISFMRSATSPEAIYAVSEDARDNLIEGIVYTTIQKDIIERYNPSSPALLAKIVEFIRINSSQSFAMKSIKDTLNNQLSKKDHVGLVKIEEYFHFLKMVYFCHECKIFSYRKKDVLNRANNKFYLNDWGMAVHGKEFERGRILENIIFMELLKKKYEVMTYLSYSNSNLEVDFVAKKKNHNMFIQVAWMLGDRKENKQLYEREFGNLSSIREEGEKILISMDKVTSEAGILTMQPQYFIMKHLN
ncbi:MAG: ATP-binding protein [Oligoflexia bacterium]|nr:ATP-binding protein [Oligoflexia bacterium]